MNATDDWIPYVIWGTGDVVLVDLDADGTPDLFEVNWWGPDWVYANDGTGRLDAWAALPEAEDLPAVAGAAGDVDGDGDVDLVVASSGSRTRLFARVP